MNGPEAIQRLLKEADLLKKIRSARASFTRQRQRELTSGARTLTPSSFWERVEQDYRRELRALRASEAPHGAGEAA